MLPKEYSWADIKINICGREIDCLSIQYELNSENLPITHSCSIELEMIESTIPVLISSELEEYNNKFELYLRRKGKVYLRNKYGFKLVFPIDTPFIKDLPLRAVFTMDFKQEFT